MSVAAAAGTNVSAGVPLPAAAPRAPTAERHAPGSKPRGHIPALDGLRGIAVLLVLLVHGMHLQSATLADKAVRLGVSFGWAGVDLFFVLSGFLITGILADTRTRPNYFRAFYARRTLRIFPLYYGYCIGLFAVTPLVLRLWAPHDSHTGETVRALSQAAPWYFSYLMNVRVALANSWQATVAGTAFLWSLGVEEQFYLIWPFVVRRLDRRRAMAACVALMIAAPLFRGALLAGGRGTFGAYVLLPSRMDALAAGAWLALAARGPRGLAPLARLALPAAAVGAAVVAAIVLGTGYGGWDTPLMETVGFSAIALTFAGALAAVVGAEHGSGAFGRASARLCTSATLRFFGRYSYGIYVFATVGSWLATWLGVGTVTLPPVLGSELPQALARLAGEVACIVAIALVSWHLYEKWFLKMKERFSYGAAALPVP